MYNLSTILYPHKSNTLNLAAVSAKKVATYVHVANYKEWLILINSVLSWL